MKKIESYRADNGQLETDPMRAKAHDIQSMFERKRQTYGGTKESSKVEFTTALALLEHAEQLIEHLEEWIAIKNEPARSGPKTAGKYLHERDSTDDPAMKDDEDLKDE